MAGASCSARRRPAKKKRRAQALLFSDRAGDPAQLDLLKVAGARPLGAVDHLEGHRLALFEAVEVDGGELGAVEERFRAVVAADESETAVGADHLDTASGHLWSSRTRADIEHHDTPAPPTPHGDAPGQHRGPAICAIESATRKRCEPFRVDAQSRIAGPSLRSPCHDACRSQQRVGQVGVVRTRRRSQAGYGDRAATARSRCDQRRPSARATSLETPALSTIPCRDSHGRRSPGGASSRRSPQSDHAAAVHAGDTRRDEALQHLVARARGDVVGRGDAVA